MRTKLWPKAPAKEGALGQISKNLPVYFVHINFFKKPNKKICNRAKEKLRCYIFFRFSIVYLPKKNWHWKMAQGCRLSPIWQNECYDRNVSILIVFVIICIFVVVFVAKKALKIIEILSELSKIFLKNSKISIEIL